MNNYILRLLACVSFGPAACVAGAGDTPVGEPATRQVGAKITQQNNNAICKGKYQVKNLSALPGSHRVGGVSGVSPGGVFVGSAAPPDTANQNQAITWSEAGGVTLLGLPPGHLDGGGIAINNAGQIAGNSLLPDRVSVRGFFYDPASGFQEIGTFGGEDAAAFDINASGTVVGEADRAVGLRHAFAWHDGVMTDLGTFPGGYYSSARAINDAGVIVGGSSVTEPGFTHAVKWAGGTVTDLAPSAEASDAFAVNEAGLAAGGVTKGEFSRPVIFLGDGNIIDLSHPNFEEGAAYGINDRGQAVGGLSRPVNIGFLYQDGLTWNLNDLVENPDPSLPVHSARAINDAGQIAAMSFGPPGGFDLHALVLTPVECPYGFKAVETGIFTNTIAVPEGVGVGDLLITALEVDADPVEVTPPEGWSLVHDQPSGVGTPEAFHTLVFSHRVTGEEPESYTFEVSQDAFVALQLAAYGGLSGVDAAAGTSARGAEITAPSVTATGPNDVVLTFYTNFGGGTWSIADGLTERSNFNGNSLQDIELAGPGATPPRSATADVENTITAVTVALK